MDWNNWIFN